MSIDTSSSNAKESWCTPDQARLTITLPTGNSYKTQDQNCIRPLLGMVFELLQPIFVFGCNENIYDMFYKKPYQAPWNFYWDTMVFGASLVESIGSEHLKRTPAFRFIELDGPMIWISSISGLGDESSDMHYAHVHRSSENRNESLYYGDNNLARLNNFMARAHYHAVSEHLGLKKWEKTYLPIETEAQQKFLEWMIQFWSMEKF
jgi:hypothetical protein